MLEHYGLVFGVVQGVHRDAAVARDHVGLTKPTTVGSEDLVVPEHRDDLIHVVYPHNLHNYNRRRSIPPPLKGVYPQGAGNESDYSLVIEGVMGKQQDKPQVNIKDLLLEAMLVPGGLGNTYNRFKVGADGNGYSFLNMIWLMSQGVKEPCAPFGVWKKYKRFPRKGSGKWLLHPKFVWVDDKDANGNKTGKKKQILIGFDPKRTTFPYSETDGEDIEWPEIPAWNLEAALNVLGITKVDYESLDGNCQGYSSEKEYAINPVAKYQVKTTFHELAHIVLGHTTADKRALYQEHRGIMEFQAEAVAYLVAHELELEDWNPSESRGYIQHWLAGKYGDVTEKDCKQIFGAVTKILDAGRQAPAKAVVGQEVAA